MSLFNLEGKAVLQSGSESAQKKVTDGNPFGLKTSETAPAEQPVGAALQVEHLDSGKNVFGLDRRQGQSSTVNTAQEIAAKQERQRALTAGEIPPDEMTDGERAAYLLKHLKD